MRKTLAAMCGVVAMTASLMGAEQPELKPERHVFTIHAFHAESSVTLPETHVVYGTYGHLNAKHDSAILMPSHYLANLHGYLALGATACNRSWKILCGDQRVVRQWNLLVAEQYA